MQNNRKTRLKAADTSIARRTFLGAAVASCTVNRTGAAGWLANGGSNDDLNGSADLPYPGLIIRQKQPENLEFPFYFLDSFLTPNERFFVRNHFPAPQIDRAAWRLRVEGAVTRTIEISYDELLKMPSHTVTATLECAGNGRVFLVPSEKGVQWAMGAVGNAEWTGVSLMTVLEHAGIKQGAVQVVLEGADEGEVRDDPKSPGKVHFARGLPMPKATGPDVILAYHMNGQELPVAHGFPVRAIVPGWYGVASVKWLARIVIMDSDFHGFYQSLDYSYWKRIAGLATLVPITEMEVKAEIARPVPQEVVRPDTDYRVFGAAWTSESEVTKVEISTDGGATWHEARLLSKSTPHAWRLWEYQWRVPPSPAHRTLIARATDARGRTQPMTRDPDRRNYMISHLLPIEVQVQ